MLTSKQIKEIREHLDKAQNPLFLYDNDADGLCSFLLLRRFSGKGKGVAIKSYPSLDKKYFKKAEELGSDYIFILDKPVVSDDFWKEVEQYNIPVVWIDHHELQSDVPDGVEYYNPIYNKEKTNEPVTDLCYNIVKQKNDLWLAVVGCIADGFVPKYYVDFLEKYPDLGIDTKSSLEILYKSQIGEIAKMFGAGLKDRISNVVKMSNFLIKVKSPYEVLEETPVNSSMHERYNFLNKKYKKFIEKATEERSSGKLLFFKYGGGMSISADLANELTYLFPDKIVVVVYVNGFKANVSGRGVGVREFVLDALHNLKNASGGGHKNAVGAQVSVDDLGVFQERLEKLIFD